jgi:hypothetical protein
MCNPFFAERKSVNDERTKQIAEMNDRFRVNFYVPCFGPRTVPGHILCTAGEKVPSERVSSPEVQGVLIIPGSFPAQFQPLLARIPPIGMTNVGDPLNFMT